MRNNDIESESKLVAGLNSPQQRQLISVVVPVYNEEAIIEKNLDLLYHYLKSLEHQYCWELMIINDGSTDSTGDLAESFAKNMNNVHVYHHMFNFRLGQALKYAFNQCQGDYIVVMDIDLSYSPDHIGKMLEKMKETRAKIVIASPYAKNGKVTNVPWVRKVLSIWANRFLCFLATKDWFSDRLTNITGMVRTYDGQFLRRMSLWAMDVDINPEIIYKAKILRARIVEIPAHLDWELGKSKLTGARRKKSSLRIMRSIIQSILSGFILRPFMFFILPGVGLLIISTYPLIWALIHTVSFYKKLANLTPIDNRLSVAIGEAFKFSPHSFVVGGVTLLVAIQLISLGFLAFQKKRYFEELFHLGSMIYRDSRFRTRGDNNQKI